MPESKTTANEKQICRDRLAELLNEDLSREYQAIIGYVVYSQVLSGAQYMDIAAQLEIHSRSSQSATSYIAAINQINWDVSGRQGHLVAAAPPRRRSALAHRRWCHRGAKCRLRGRSECVSCDRFR